MVLLLSVNGVMTFRAARAAYGAHWTHAWAIGHDEAGRRAFAAMADQLRMKGTDTPFCKTLYIPLDLYYDPRLVHLPHGYGVSVVTLGPAGMLPALRGKYVIVGKSQTVFTRALDASADWMKIGRFQDFLLYRSRRACQA